MRALSRIVAAVVVLAVLSVACGQERGPTSPTPVAPVTPAPATVIEPEPAWFDDETWRDLAFDGWQNSSYVPNERTAPLDYMPNLYIQTVTTDGTWTMPPEYLDYIIEEWAETYAELTGTRWTGIVETGTVWKWRLGWVTVDYDHVGRGCASTPVGGNPTGITFNVEACASFEDLRHAFAHEAGHALGLSHSRDPRHTMHPSGTLPARESFRTDEIDHARLLYRVGIGKAYCGWPFGPECH